MKAKTLNQMGVRRTRTGGAVRRETYAHLLTTFATSITDAAAQLGVDKATISRRVSGQSPVTREAYLAAQHLNQASADVLPI